MINIYVKKVGDAELSEVKKIEKGAWINVANPDNEEIKEISKKCSVPVDLIQDCLDKFEKARCEREDNVLLLTFRVPVLEEKPKIKKIYTIPFGVIITEDVIITISLTKIGFVDELIKDKNMFTTKKTRMVLQIISLIDKSFLRFLRLIERETEELEPSLGKSIKNIQIIKNLSLKKTLTYFSTSVIENNNLLKRIFAGKIVKLYKEDEEFLEDLIVDSNQTIEMVSIYGKILSNTLDSYSSVISNNLNTVMKVLAALTVILAIPNIISGFFGMNVDLPLATNPNSFLILAGLASFVCLIALVFFIKKGWV